MICSSLSSLSLESSIRRLKNGLHSCLFQIKQLGNIVCLALTSYWCSALVLLSFNCGTRLYLYAQLELSLSLVVYYSALSLCSALSITWLCLFTQLCQLLGSIYLLGSFCCSAHMCSAQHVACQKFKWLSLFVTQWQNHTNNLPLWHEWQNTS